jgi:membrane-bound serine protease (ClpP class)
MRVFLTLLAALVLPVMVRAQADAPAAAAAPVEISTQVTAKKAVMVIPVREAIDKPILYVLRRGLKEAIERKVDGVVLDMKTPGGGGRYMLEIMEALDKYPGDTMTYVNDEATSAGALIAAVTDGIYFAPRATMGSAEPVDGSGKDIDESMKRKVTAYMSAKIDAYLDTDPRRADVIKAMMNPDFELKIDDTVIKPKGELLNLSAKRAFANVGTPPRPLLAAGIAKDVDDVLTQKYGAGNFTVQRLEVTWSEELASYLTTLSPILMGLGLLAIFIEFKTPGFGFFGIAGGLLLGVVFFGHYAAGLSGHEPALVFVLGVLLVLAEILFFPGVIVAALTGVLLMLGALVWSMADLWPNEPVTINSEVFTGPLISMGLGVLVALALAVALARFLPRGWFWDKMVLQAAIDTHSQASATDATGVVGLVGKRGVAATALMPSGQIEIDGRRYEARVDVGVIDAGAPVVVVRRSDFSLIVERVHA